MCITKPLASAFRISFATIFGISEFFMRPKISDHAYHSDRLSLLIGYASFLLKYVCYDWNCFSNQTENALKDSLEFALFSNVNFSSCIPVFVRFIGLGIIFPVHPLMYLFLQQSQIMYN